MLLHFRHLTSVIFTALVVVSCSSAPPRPVVDIKISNDSTNDLTWVRVCWDEGEESAGVLPAGIWKVSLDAGLPKKPKSETAFVEFADEKDDWTGKDNSQRKRYRIPVDVSPLRQLTAGHYGVTFSILSFTEAKLQIEKKDR